jgi:hypothetical protein
MKQIDKYYFFLNNAISEPNKLEKYKYFFDPVNSKLIRKNLAEIDNEFLNNTLLLELPKLSKESKKNFIIDFAKKQNKNLKKIILDIAENFTELSKFDLHNDLKKIDNNLAVKFYFESGIFLSNSIDKLYSKFNLNENMTIEF